MINLKWVTIFLIPVNEQDNKCNHIFKIVHPNSQNKENFQFFPTFKVHSSIQTTEMDELSELFHLKAQVDGLNKKPTHRRLLTDHLQNKKISNLFSRLISKPFANKL